MLGICWLGIQAHPDLSFFGEEAPEWVQSERGFHVIALVAAVVGGTAMLMVAATLRSSDSDAEPPRDKTGSAG